MIAKRYGVSDSAWKDGGAEYKKILQRALHDAHAGKFALLIVGLVDRIVRNGSEDALHIIRLFPTAVPSSCPSRRLG